MLIAQEFLPTPFDWRVGIIDGQVIYVRKYFMASKTLTNNKFIDFEEQMKYKTDGLVQVYEKVLATGLFTEIDAPEYLKVFGLTATCTVRELWQIIIDRLVAAGNTALEKWKPELSVILKEGSLSERIIKALDNDHSPEAIAKTYYQLSGCLAQNKMFIP